MASCRVLMALVASLCLGVASSTDSAQKECITPACRTEANRMQGLMDSTAKPCQDFSQFACGEFFKTAEVPPTKEVFGSFHDIKSRDVQLSKKLLESPIEDDCEDSYERKMKTIYKACMNADAIQSHGLKDYKESDKLAWPSLNPHWTQSSFSLQNLTSKSLKENTEAIFQVYSTTEKTHTGAKRRVYEIAAPYHDDIRITLGDPKLAEIETYYTEVAQALGADESVAKRDAKEVVKFMLEFNWMQAKYNYRLRNNDSVPTHSTLQDLNKHYPYLDWTSLLKDMFGAMNLDIGLDQEFITVPYLTFLGDYLDTFDKRLIANLFGFTHAIRVVGEANQEMSNITRDFKMKTEAVPTRQMDRFEYCVGVVKRLYSKGLGKLMLKTLYTDQAENAIAELLRNTKAAFKASFQGMPWMEASTQQKAVQKLENLKYKIGIQKKRFDDADLDLLYTHFVVNENNFNADFHQNMIQRRGLTFNKDFVESWRWTSSMVGYQPFYLENINEIDVPMGAMQEPLFKVDNPSYVNYGALGSLIGSQIARGFKAEVEDNDYFGKKLNWWSEKDYDGYMDRVQCFKQQYSHFYNKQLKRFVDGNETADYNINDHIGSVQAYNAYQIHASQHDPEPLLPIHGLTSDQLFFLSMAQVNCVKFTNDSLSSETVFAPPAARINGMLQNSEAFSKVFQCAPGDPMNPTNRCTLF